MPSLPLPGSLSSPSLLFSPSLCSSLSRPYFSFLRLPLPSPYYSLFLLSLLSLSFHIIAISINSIHLFFYSSLITLFLSPTMFFSPPFTFLSISLLHAFLLLSFPSSPSSSHAPYFLIFLYLLTFFSFNMLSSCTLLTHLSFSPVMAALQMLLPDHKSLINPLNLTLVWFGG